MDLGLAGRVYILTGASRGLGLALAHSLAADGWHLLIDGRDPSALHAATARTDRFRIASTRRREQVQSTAAIRLGRADHW